MLHRGGDMRKSISRIINPDNGFLIATVNKQKESIDRWEVEKAFGKIPKSEYRVTYTLSEKGKYKVQEENDAGSMLCLVHPGNHPSNMAICWIPFEWAGKMVNRRVEILPKRRTK
jgi:hypothetical protein